MAKTPRKVTKSGKSTGGKNLSSYMNSGFDLQSRRRFSIAQSSSSDDDEPRKVHYVSDSQSDSSLTAVSDNGPSEQSSMLFDDTQGGKGKGKGKKFAGKNVSKGKSLKSYGKMFNNSDSEVSVISDEEESSSDDSDVDFVKLQAQKKIRSMPERRRGSVTKPKYGRRRSETALPEDIKFEFEFKGDENALESDSGEEEEADEEDDDDNDDENDDNEEDDIGEDVGEDIGEEVKDSILLEEEDLGEAIDGPIPDDNKLKLDLDFNIPVPNFNEEDLNSDEDYEIDDNELLATLQADNDLEDFDEKVPKRNSIVSIDEDEEEFLKQEEKFLVNEFENNGFDEEGKQYSDEEDEFEDDFDDMVDFTMDLDQEEFNSGKKVSKIKRKGYDSDDDDDSYLWNYFFSSDNDSESGDLNSPKKNKDSEYLSIALDNHDDENYDSGESTDVDSNIPTSNNSAGSQKAKEVLSSKTADYRPPVLGTWIAVESKPFSIIDGLSTRSLNSNYRHSIAKPYSKRRKSFVGTPHADDSALGLDELLNVSEMDYDDTNDVKIWRDFNNQKKRVPLGAFRNKSYLQNSPQDVMASNVQYNHTTKTNNDFNQRRYSLSNHKKKNLTPVPPKSKRRRASKVEAFNEGYRPTKSGLFSEQALLDVEEVLGDDNDIMALIKGL
ncbi:transcriptional regulator Ifh1p [[Candida] jaroonii]|uniref:Transcriptional regulator Ifh1p n=1 Tax=[Candida] jaroonii TaxID=467808 RepID=A0ACA9Y5X2_9ASCO|nr:transcriptional regulator Ifh1p [[Candida] jaroonii]